MTLSQINRYKSMQKPLSVVLFLAMIFMPFAPVVSMPSVARAAVGDITYFDNPGSTLWTVPAGVTSVKVKVWAGGGAAGDGEKITNQNRASLGGGAGGYTDETISVTPGQSYLIEVGAGGQGINNLAGRVGNTGGDSKFEGNGVSLKTTGGTGGATDVGFGNPMDPIGFGGIGDGGPNANNQGGGNSLHATWDGDNWDSSSGGSAYAGGQGGSRGRLGRDGTGHCNGYTEAYTGGPLNIPCSSTDAWAKDGGFPGGGGGGSDTGHGGFGANGRVSIEEVAPANPVPSGFVDGADCSAVNGWAYDTSDANASINVHFYADGPAGSGTFLGAVLANGSRPDLNAINIPGNHGYSFPIPDSLKDNQSHTIYAYGIDLDSSINSNNAVLISSADNVSDHRTISGCTIPSTPTINNAPTGLSVSGPTTGTVNASYSFNGTATDPENGQVRYGFDWDNNGSIDEFTGFVSSGTAAGLPHTFTTAATYTFQVYALDAAGNQSAVVSHTIVISPTSTPSGINSVSISVTPNPAVIPYGGSLQLVIDSTAAVSGFASLTEHGIEMRVNGGAWTNAGAWNNPLANSARTTDASFTALNLTTGGSYDFRTYASIDNGGSYTYSNISTVPVTVANPPASTLDSVSISVTPNPVVIPNGGNVQLVITSTAAVTGSATLTNHGVEVSVNGGAYSNAGAWNNPLANSARTTDTSFTALNLTTAGSYTYRTYGSIDGVNYVYSTPVTVPVTVSTNHAPIISGVVGPVSGLVNTSYVFTATATDQDGDAVEYGFDWNNNGTIDTGLGEAWTPAVASGTAVGRSNIWTTNGNQSFQVLVRDPSGASTSFPFSISITGGASNIGFTMATSSTGFSTSEAGGTAIFSIVLNSAPLANVTLPIMSADFTEGTTSVTSLIFTPSNWNVSQSVTITGVDDVLFDGDISYNINIGPSTSSDVNYNNLSAQTLSLVNFDNEITPGVGGTISSFGINPTTVTSGSSVTVSWAATNSTLCVASGAWLGNQNAVSGSVVVGPFTTTVATTTIFSIACGNSNGTSTQSVTLTINPASSGGSSSGSSGGSGGGGYSGPCIGFGCPSTGTPASSSDVTILIDTPSSSGGSVPSPAKSCPSVDFITTYLKKGIENNPNEVKKLQYFLNKYDNATLTVSGTFDDATENAVKTFQARNAGEVLSPWGTDVPTGIVYITTTAAINRIFCGDNPTYNGDTYLKDILTPVLYTPVDNSGQFQNVVGSATTSTSTNIASVFGAISGDILGLLQGIPWYELLLLLLTLLGAGFMVQGIFKKDILLAANTALFARGLTTLAIASVLNVLNTLSFMIRPEWFAERIGMTEQWLLGLDVINLLAVIVIILSLLVVIHRKLLTSSVK